MLQMLSIHNIALIESLDVDFVSGFHVLTGETGAGKSIIIDAVNFVLGERANRDLIKSGTDKASVQAVLAVSDYDALSKRLLELGIEEDETLILSRELNISGKGTCRINGTLVNLSALKSVSDLLVDIHGQHEHQSLLHADQHIRFLDEFDKSEILPLKARLSCITSEMQSLRKELHAGFPSEHERLRRIDILSYQIKEIEDAKLTDDEEELLTSEYNVLSNAQQILEALEESYSLLLDDGGALINAGEAKRRLEDIQSFHEDYEDAGNRLADAYYALEDVGFTLRDLKSDFDFNPERLEAIEERLDTIHNLERKYGGSIPDVLEFYEKACEEVAALEQSDKMKEQLSSRYKNLKSEYTECATLLTVARNKNAKSLEAALIKQLRDLGMENAVFEVSMDTIDGYGENGVDSVEFLLSTNAGEPVKPLQKVASGGELSRIMLAFKTIHIGEIGTIIFDEIDTGISGHTAAVVGEKMRQIARDRQVICVTHLPQIAAMADVHYVVKKTELKNNTISTVTRLDDDGRVKELAHIMGATEENASAMEHARDLLQRSHK